MLPCPVSTAKSGGEAMVMIPATTACSAPWCRIRTFALVVQSTCSFSVCIDTEGSHVPCNRLAQDQATYMPDTVPPVIRFRRNFSRSLLTYLIRQSSSFAFRRSEFLVFWRLSHR